MRRDARSRPRAARNGRSGQEWAAVSTPRAGAARPRKPLLFRPVSALDGAMRGDGVDKPDLAAAARVATGARSASGYDAPMVLPFTSPRAHCASALCERWASLDGEPSGTLLVDIAAHGGSETRRARVAPPASAVGSEAAHEERRRRRGASRLSIMLLATLDTKREEVEYTVEALAENGIHARVYDVSLPREGRWLDGQAKIEAMQRIAAEAMGRIGPLLGPSFKALMGVGGGTGGQIIADVMRQLPFGFPKVLVTTLPFDPRAMLADNSITIVPTLADISGLNATLRQSLDQAAAMVRGICTNPRPSLHVSERPSIGITALSATGPGVDALQHAIRQDGREATVFHSNGFGGAALVRWCDAGAFDGVIDYTIHDLTRMHVGGASTNLSRRFRAAAENGVPQVLVPGGVNFIGLGEIAYLGQRYLERPHYHHSRLFTHVKMTEEEMVRCATALGEELVAARSPVTVLVPMGGFSTEDRPGGAVEDETLRGVFLQALREAAGDRFPIEPRDEHINDAAFARAAYDALLPHLD